MSLRSEIEALPWESSHATYVKRADVLAIAKRHDEMHRKSISPEMAREIKDFYFPEMSEHTKLVFNEYIDSLTSDGGHGSQVLNRLIDEAEKMTPEEYNESLSAQRPSDRPVIERNIDSLFVFIANLTKLMERLAAALEERNGDDTGKEE